ncbi:hypothetical protein A4H97_10530 [Niastella yeongjuensis]|uniref:Uncharacterized protein n=1 Tax=Niastella yeongjuensis TaxID=354355 RepID=A0A1V9EF73_9BACT|nr:hypothetical protein [Niastella yeongjuensis]OQP44789.1 hypothetical protein A4H97_10530 [Niastella yeongjuensis]SEP42398.1 hypothetical protein SAMN05660816_05994 [Niastella yeongjuensis]
MKGKSYLLLLILFVFLSGTASYAQNSAPAAVSPCDSTLSPKLLNSERIEKKFGGYGIDVLYTSGKVRVSNLYDGNKVTRTLAVVDYPDFIDSSFSKEHELIVQGGSIGNVFKTNGWTIDKKNIFLGELEPSASYNKLYALMGNIPPSKLSVWIYVFNVRKDGKAFPYATITEVYHPDYLSLANLKCINKNADLYLEETKPVSRELKKVKKIMTLDYKVQPELKK